MKHKAKEFILPAAVLSVFLSASAIMWFSTHNPFYLFDLPFLGCSVTVGIVVGIFQNDRHPGLGRRVSQLLVGSYFLFFLNLVLHVNMQIEGFFFQLFAGVFLAAVVHYGVAKVSGPLVFGRGFCAYGCWSAMVFDFLPWKKSSGRRPGLGWLRHLHLGLVVAVVAILYFGLGVRQPIGSDFGFISFMVGTAAYWAIGVIMAAAMKDNRAFCKYLCPIAPIMKPIARLSLMKISINASSCTGCKACERACPMDVKLLAARDAGTRVLDTECIQCSTCGIVCQTKAIKTTIRLPGKAS